MGYVYLLSECDNFVLCVPNFYRHSFALISFAVFYPLFQKLTVHRSTKEDQGAYECKVKDHSGHTQSKTEFVRILEEEESYLRLYYEGFQTIELGPEDKHEPVQWVVQIESHPQPTVEW